MTLKDELTVIDAKLAELEDRRTALINRMDLSGRRRQKVGKNVIEFPSRPGVVVTNYNAARHVWNSSTVPTKEGHR